MFGSNEPGAPATPRGPGKGAVAAVVVTMGLLAALVWAIRPARVDFQPAPLDPVPESCPRVGREFVPSDYTEIPALSLGELTPEQRLRALYRLNFEPCPCGCNGSVADCRVNNPYCKISKELAEKIIAEVKEQSRAAR